MSVFLQVGRRLDGRTFTVEQWPAEGIAIVVHRDGSLETVALAPREQASIELVQLDAPAAAAVPPELLDAA